MSFGGINERLVCFETFVAQPKALSWDVKVYHPHKRGLSYEVLSIMSLENIPTEVFTEKNVAQTRALLSDVEDYHPRKCGSSYKMPSMISFEISTKRFLP